jgi:hypothetical protein
VEGEDGDAVFAGEVGEVIRLVGVPAIVHHDLDAVVAGLGRPGISPVEPERIQGAGAEDHGYGHRLRPRISTNCSSVEGEWFW